MKWKEMKNYKEHYILVVNGTFSDVTLSWGSVVALFYVACRFVVKAAEINSVDLVRSIINWTMPFIRKTCILTWIREQGGWGAIRSYFGTPTWQTVGVFLAGVLTVGLVLYKM
ncbi:apoptosis regulator BAX-like isoform X1 [Danio rerio]|uniref:Apoptosis regulator BAX-like isoform X1 n=1 Tax=Danio rerio TaxID=7955 RepID=A0AC58I7U7_DANRE